MSSLKKILLIGFIVVLLIAIPVTVFLIQQQSKTKSGAVAATTISILPANKTASIGDQVNFQIEVNPATATTTNLVSLVKFTLMYDSTKLATSGSGFVVNTNAVSSIAPLTILQGPTYGNGTISVTVSAGGNAAAVIQKVADIATVTFTAIAATPTAPTQITFGNDTQVLSLGSTDQFNENVLSSANPASLIINGAGPTDTPTPTPTGEVTPTDTPTPTPAATVTPTPTTAANAPVCSSLTADNTSGTAPLTSNLTVAGSSANSTISKVSFTFGDGQSQDITSAGGIGTNSVSVLQAHTYSTAGTYQATATLTDANNLVSANCTLAITVNAGTAVVPTATPTPTTTPIPTVTPTQIANQPTVLPPTGPADIIKLGSLGIVITIVGAMLLFAL